MILLDTNALIWVDQGHKRACQLLASRQRVYISPTSLLELELLSETGRIELTPAEITSLADDERWLLDDPPAAAWFETALHLGWTRDPFDRLLAAHAQFRGWKLATGDQALLAHLGTRHGFEL